ncbi:gastrula zinc finger protein XlCGF46.1-like isoform X1 [Ochlerotatus camptorhynchus]|uniref:gastrula zinc finger protein XlCGF46.1-like isoform X1 n=1 Tax=Ochlerotatus camptorhynchus TaxID=644619 RepID=UPI0031D81EB0
MALLEISNQPCRICFDTVENTVPLCSLEEGKTLTEMLWYCVKLEFCENDGLPYRCCMDCKGDLVVAYKLIARCRESDSKFRNQLAENKCTVGKLFTDKHLTEDFIKTELESEIECVYTAPIKEESSDSSADENDQDNKDDNYVPDNDDDDEDGEEDENEAAEDNNEDEQTDEQGSSDLDGDTPERKRRKYVKRKLSSTPKRCCKCKARFEDSDQSEEHSKVHFYSRIIDPQKIAARPHECSMCFKRYTKRRALQFHQRDMYIDKPFKCDECEQEFISETELNSHKQSHGKELDEKKGQLPKCCACYEQFDTEESLQKHCIEVHLPESQSANNDKVNEFACHVCYRRYKTRRSLLNHKLKPYRNKQYQCAECGRIFRDKCALSDHERRHQGEQPFVCPVCSKPFAIKDSFRKHVKSHSIDDDHFKCETCGKGFKTKGNLKDHYITHASDYRPLVCSLCPATFARKSCLKSHMRMHTGEKPFKCHLCDASYAFSSDLKRHIMAHTGIKPYICNVCGRGYPRQDYLRKHLASHNNSVS